jgi:homocysteine S-methyltransferase
MNFIQSGSVIIETSSYQLHPDNLIAENGITVDEAKEIIRKSVRVAEQARIDAKKPEVLIAGSIGPYGATKCDGSEYHGRYANEMTLEELMDWHRPRLECLVEANCDLLAIETIPSIKEAQAVVNLLSLYPNVKAWLSFSCKDGLHLCNGEEFKVAYETFKDNEQLVAVGVNCTSPFDVTSLLKSVIDGGGCGDKAFIVYANDGRLWNAEKQKFMDMDGNGEAPILKMVNEWVELGAKYVGGCCNVGSKEIKQMQEKLKYN